MPHLELTVEQILELVKQLSIADKKSIFSALHEELNGTPTEWDAETKEWLTADLVEDLPAYDWGSQGAPAGQPIHYVPGVGVVITGEQKFG